MQILSVRKQNKYNGAYTNYTVSYGSVVEVQQEYFIVVKIGAHEFAIKNDTLDAKEVYEAAMIEYTNILAEELEQETWRSKLEMDIKQLVKE